MKKILVSGVGVSIAKALVTLGDDIHFMTIPGKNHLGEMALKSLRDDGINTALDKLYMEFVQSLL